MDACLSMPLRSSKAKQSFHLISGCALLLKVSNLVMQLHIYYMHIYCMHIYCMQDTAEGNTAGEGQTGTSSPACAGARLFPFMLQQRCPNLFSYAASNFRVQRSKAGTARIVCWQELGIANRCCTYQSSVCSAPCMPALRFAAKAVCPCALGPARSLTNSLGFKYLFMNRYVYFVLYMSLS